MDQYKQVCLHALPHAETDSPLSLEDVFFFQRTFRMINSLPNDKILDQSRFKALAKNTINVSKKIKTCFEKGRTHFTKRIKC